MKTKPTFRLYKIETKLITHSIWNYFDTKRTFEKELEFLRQQNKNVVGYKFIKGEYTSITI